MKISIESDGVLSRDLKVRQITDDGISIALKNLTSLAVYFDLDQPNRAVASIVCIEHTSIRNVDAEFLVGTKDGRMLPVKKIIFADGSEDIYE